MIYHQNNILVNASEHAILTDFGRARMIGDVFYSTPLMAGTAQYMAPELFPPTDEVDINKLFSKKSDVYAFGILSYERKSHSRATMLAWIIRLCLWSRRGRGHCVPLMCSTAFHRGRG